MRARVRNIALLSLLMTGLAACSGSDPIEPTPEPEAETPISFSGGLPDEKSMTRATGLETVQTSFKVYGYKNDAYDATNGYTSYQTVMPGFTVNYGANTAYTTTTNTNDWEYVGIAADQTVKYWDWGANAYRFFGYALGSDTADPATTAATVTVSDSGDSVTFSAVVDAASQATIDAAPYFSRLWFSTGNATDYPTRQFGQPVTLEFVKPYARVRFMFTYVEGINVDRSKLRNPEFMPVSGSIATAGTVTVSYPLTGTATSETWTTKPTTTIPKFVIDYYDEADASYTPADAFETTYDNTPHKWYTVLPQSLGAFRLSVQVVTTDAKTVIVPAEYMDWQAGYEYTYKFKITETGGVTLDIIQVAINQWGTDHAISHPVFNW